MAELDRARHRGRRFPTPALRVASVMAGGAVGTLARAGVGQTLPSHAGSWPWATFAVNLTGALILGWLVARLTDPTATTEYWRLTLGTGFCGALTTFSTFQVETIRLADDGYPGVAFAYAATSLTLGMALAVAGTMIGGRGART